MWATLLSMLAAKGQRDANQAKQPTIENVFTPGQIDLNKKQYGQNLWPR